MHAALQAARDLLTEHSSLATLAAVAEWQARAKTIIRELEIDATAADQAAEEAQRSAADLRASNLAKSFFARFFKSGKEKTIASTISSHRAHCATCRSLEERLQGKIAETPGSKEEQVQLLKELKLRKKELQLEKKEINAQMKGIRTQARQKSANAATSFTALMAGSKYTAAERRSIRYNKEHALAPHEQSRAGIDAELLAVEREMLRIESFS